MIATKERKKNCMSCRLNRRISFQALTEEPTDTGGLLKTYITFKTVFAEVIPLGGGKYLLNRQVGENPTHKILIRYIPDLRKDLFINLKQKPGDPDRLLQIIGPIENIEEQNAFLVITAKEIKKEDAN